ncbi:FlgD immunoglobulin-like domain containing protein, partial [Calditrichota bacterium]
MKSILALIILTTLIAAPLYAQYEVQGEHSGTWEIDRSPYTIVGEVTVPEDEELEIEPGVEVIFEEDMQLIVLGCLKAVGTEDDSISFSSLSRNQVGTGIHITGLDQDTSLFDYCKFQYLNTAIDVVVGRTTIANSDFNLNIVSVYMEGSCGWISSSKIIGDSLGFNGTVMFNDRDADERHDYTIENCEFILDDGRISMLTLSRLYFLNNRCRSSSNADDYVDMRIESCRVAYCSDNVNLNLTMNYYSGRIWEVIVENSQIYDLDIYNAYEYGIIVRNNEIRGSVHIGSYAELYDNQIAFGIETVDPGIGPHLILEGNLFESFGLTASYNTDITLINNTLIRPDSRPYDAIIVRNDSHGDGYESSITLTNNIIGTYADDYTMIVDDRFEEINGGYNCYFGVAHPYGYGNNLQRGDIITNPKFRGGYDFDYRLRVDSPCIDAGNPRRNEDPDGTRMDMGAFFFDQENGEPPALDKPLNDYASLGQRYRYEAKAFDEAGELDIEFSRLPYWLEVDEGRFRHDFVTDFAVVSGVVPAGQGDFWFDVKVTDNAGLADSTSVSVKVYPYTVLTGIVRGTLDIDDSPFIVVDNAWIPAGDSLVLPPGTELYFDNREDALVGRSYSQLLVGGYLKAVGTREDSILFRGLDASIYNYGMVFLPNVSDVSEYRYCVFKGFRNSNVRATNVKVSNCLGVEGYANYVHASGYNISSEIHDNAGDLKIYLYGNGNVRNNTGIDVAIVDANDTVEIYNNIDIDIRSGSEAPTIVSNNSIRYLSCGGYTIARDNLITKGIRLINAIHSTITNNLILNPGNTIIKTHPNNSELILLNNVIYNGSLAFEIYEIGNPEDYLHNLVIENNIIYEIDSLIVTRTNNTVDGALRYNSIFNIDEFPHDSVFSSSLIQTNANADSVDANFNLYIDPEIASLDSLDFRLFEDSPLINAGNPDNVFNDMDSTVNDIGLFGGPYGEMYDYPTSVGDSDVPVPEGFSMSALYPNPFNASTSITFTLPSPGDVTLRVYDVTGRLVYDQLTPLLQAGAQNSTWHGVNNDGVPLSTGIYFLELDYQSAKLVHRAVMLR